MNIKIILTPGEMGECYRNPVILRALADHHDVCATMADAVGEEYAGAVVYHENRAKELRAEADRIEDEY